MLYATSANNLRKRYINVGNSLTMRQFWTDADLAEHWTLLPDEKKVLGKKTGENRLVFAIMLKFFQYFGRFPETSSEIAKEVIKHLATQLAVAESFFHTLKVELVHQTKFKTKEEAKTAIFEYIEIFYNRVRMHSANNYLSPVEYEKAQNYY